MAGERFLGDETGGDPGAGEFLAADEGG